MAHMDELVRQAMLKWPNVPDCYGWLGLDSRGQWRMRDDQVQRAGPFQSGSTHAKGSVLRHGKMLDFIQRNYAADAQGRWYFQNGPQRVYVELERAPYIWRLEHGLVPVGHTGQVTQALNCLVDEAGHVYLHTNLGFGLVHTSDVGQVAQAIERGHWRAEPCTAQSLPERYGFVISPQQTCAGD